VTAEWKADEVDLDGDAHRLRQLLPATAVGVSLPIFLSMTAATFRRLRKRWLKG
jgi:hypothetical protein